MKTPNTKAFSAGCVRQPQDGYDRAIPITSFFCLYSLSCMHHSVPWMLDEAAGAWGSPGAGDTVGLWHRNGFNVLSMINMSM